MSVNEQRELAKQIIVEIIRQSDGVFYGRARLDYVFYLAHLYFFKNTGRLLSNWPIVKMPDESEGGYTEFIAPVR